MNTTPHYNHNLKVKLDAAANQGFLLANSMTPVKGLGAISHSRTISIAEQSFDKIFSVKLGSELMALKTKKAFLRAVSSGLKSLQRKKKKILGFFRAEHTAYACLEKTVA